MTTDVGVIKGDPVVVVPCYNEASRLDETSFLEQARCGRVKLLFVDDGSTDQTAEVLRRLTKEAGVLDVLSLPTNVGKAEPYAPGMRCAMHSGATVVGYCDADLSTPPRELVRLLDRLESDRRLVAVFGSRVARLGEPDRAHRVPSLTGSAVCHPGVRSARHDGLRHRVWREKEGARATPALVAALDVPFSSRGASTSCSATGSGRAPSPVPACRTRLFSRSRSSSGMTCGDRS